MEFTPGFFEVSGVQKEYCQIAIKDLFRLKRIALPVEYGEKMKQLFSGLKRLEANLNQSSSPKTLEKQPRTFSLYQGLCKSTLTCNGSGFSHLFLTTQRNLMCRSVSVQNLQT
ncbi:hypothetical protein PHMEG_00012775 [Phytophthora megakarya]|uniref:Uncharacterized protein n=1 Tax=Phytophthora megakarya TaxID=4795 RepID=A0A225W7Y2_9STRA|nr:hypothetical protein PHMEG_00012775 [Phytophthora megakarya]